MSRIWMSGLEAGSMDVFDAHAGMVVTAAHARTGTRSAWVTDDAQYAIVGFGTDIRELYVRLGLYYVGGALAFDRVFMQFYDCDEGPQLTFAVRDADNAVLVRRGGHGGVLIGNSGLVPLDAWCCIELHLFISDVAGVVQVKIDGTTVIDFTGDTQDTLVKSVFGVSIGGALSPLAYGCYGYYDDIAFNDTSTSRNNGWLRQGGIVGLLPEAPGHYTELTPSAAPNWQCTDEVPPDEDATYVEGVAAGGGIYGSPTTLRDTYTMNDLVLPAGYYAKVAAVQWLCRARNIAPQAGDISRLTRLYGIDYEGPARGLDLSYQYLKEIFNYSPDTGTGWLEEKVNDLEAGLVVK